MTATAGWDNTVRGWDLLVEKACADAHRSCLPPVSFTDDGRLAVELGCDVAVLNRSRNRVMPDQRYGGADSLIRI